MVQTLTGLNLCGNKLGVRGTPLLILPNGEIVNGYVPAERLAERIVAATFPGGAAPAAAPKSAP